MITLRFHYVVTSRVVAIIKIHRMSSLAGKRTLQRGRTSKKKEKVEYTKRFMTELQCTVAYGAYDSSEMLLAGQSTSLEQIQFNSTLINKYYLKEITL